MVTEEMRKAGSQISADLFDASIIRATGSEKDWENYQLSYDGGNIDLIRQYFNDEVDFVTVVYIAMHRVA